MATYSYTIRLKYATLDVGENPPALVKDVFPSTWQTAIETTLCVDYCRIDFATRQSPVMLGPTISIEETIS